MPFKFTYQNLEAEYLKLIAAGYQFITCREYALHKKKFQTQKIVVNRVDIDFSILKARELGKIFNRLNIKGSFFIRLHAKEYNPFDFENYKVIKELIKCGHEIGYHSEIMDQQEIWSESAEVCLKRDVLVLNSIFDIKIDGCASHGAMTGINNLDFWKNRSACEFELLYEAYDKSENFGLFDDSFYISDSEWTRWKCYDNGKAILNDHRSPSEHIVDNHKRIYLLIHSDTYFKSHFYE